MRDVFGGVIGTTLSPTQVSAPGVWTMRECFRLSQLNTWQTTSPLFMNVSLNGPGAYTGVVGNNTRTLLVTSTGRPVARLGDVLRFNLTKDAILRCTYGSAALGGLALDTSSALATVYSNVQSLVCSTLDKSGRYYGSWNFQEPSYSVFLPAGNYGWALSYGNYVSGTLADFTAFLASSYGRTYSIGGSATNVSVSNFLTTFTQPTNQATITITVDTNTCFYLPGGAQNAISCAANPGGWTLQKDGKYYPPDSVGQYTARSVRCFSLRPQTYIYKPNAGTQQILGTPLL